MREIIIIPGGTIFNRSKQYMAYADDIVILVRNTEALSEVVSQMQPAAKEAGLIINRTKTKYMESSKNRTNGLSNIMLNGQPYEGISSFKYLRSMVAYNNDVMVDIKEKIAAGNRCLRVLDNVLKVRYIAKKKVYIYIKLSLNQSYLMAVAFGRLLTEHLLF
jgi:hypothetical protein